MKGFISESRAKSSKPVGLIPKCGACGLKKTCQSPKMPVYGKGKMKILVVGEAPGEQEDEQGIPFVGRAGQQLRSSLDNFGVDLEEDCWSINSLSCRPPKNRTPSMPEIEYCRPLVMQAVRQYKPNLIIPLGVVAVKSLLGRWIDNAKATMKKWVGWQIPFQKFNAWVCPNYHPSYVIRAKEQKDGPVVKLLFERFLERSLEKAGDRPFDKVPDYEKQVKLIMDPDQVADYIDYWIEKGGTVAFDYETNRLKPDSENARIVSCAATYNGTHTIAYPFVGSAIQATRRLVRSDLGKIGANNKFEDRWSRAILGTPVKNWIWDTMLSAHHLDNRHGISSVDFQSFVRLGQVSWDEHIKPYLKSSGEDGLNQIDKIDIKDLLVYNGMDALMEYKIAQLQRKEMMNG